MTGQKRKKGQPWIATGVSVFVREYQKIVVCSCWCRPGEWQVGCSSVSTFVVVENAKHFSVWPGCARGNPLISFSCQNSSVFFHSWLVMVVVVVMKSFLPMTTYDLKIRTTSLPFDYVKQERSERSERSERTGWWYGTTLVFQTVDVKTTGIVPTGFAPPRVRSSTEFK